MHTVAGTSGGSVLQGAIEAIQSPHWLDSPFTVPSWRVYRPNRVPETLSIEPQLYGISSLIC